jgi:hypothetical protein
MTDNDVNRFLRARKDVDDAVVTICKTLAWRSRLGLDNVSVVEGRGPAFSLTLGVVCSVQMLDVPFPDFHLFRVITPHSYHKHDKDGRPLYIERSGAIDVPAVLHVIDDDALVVRHLWQMEVIAQQCAEVRVLRFMACHNAGNCVIIALGCAVL